MRGERSTLQSLLFCAGLGVVSMARCEVGRSLSLRRVLALFPCVTVSSNHVKSGSVAFGQQETPDSLYVPEQKLTTKAGWLVEALLYCAAWISQVTGMSLVVRLYCDV